MEVAPKNQERRRIVVGFGHRKRVGKDLSSELLADLIFWSQPQLTVVRQGFAENLKRLCAESFGWAGLQHPEYYDSRPEAREEQIPALGGKTHRQVWIEVGNKLRDVHPDVWVRTLLDEVWCDVLLIPDVRYMNEVLAIREAGGILVKVERDCIPHTSDVADDSLRTFTGWDRVVKNNGTIDELQEQLRGLSEVVCDLATERFALQS